MALWIAAYACAGLLVGGLVVSQLLPKQIPGKPPRIITDADRMRLGLVGLCAACAWPLPVAVAVGAWTLWAFGLAFELVIGKTR